MEQGIESQEEPGAKEKRLGALHHVGRGIKGDDIAFAASLVTVAGIGFSTDANANAGAMAIVSGTMAIVSGAGAGAGAGMVAAIAAGVSAGVGTAVLIAAVAIAIREEIFGKKVIAGVALAAGLTAGSLVYDDLTQDTSGKPAEPPAATATHDYRISGGADCLLKKAFTPSAEGRQAGNDNDIILYGLPKKCQIQEIKAPGR